MDGRLRKQMMEMLIRYGIRGETDIAQIPFYPQKTDCFSTRMTEGNTKFSTPEAEGVSSRSLLEMLQQIETHKHANVHTISVYRHGKLISEATADGYSATTWRLTHSMAKTITAIAIGQVIDEGKLTLSTKLVDVLHEECPPRVHRYMKDITVWHLLSMSAGVVGLSEPTSVVESNWTRAYLESIPAFAPGTDFKYNSMNSYMLSVILKKVTRKSLSEWLGERLFEPLGITNYLCEKGPEGIEKGGWGMYIPPRDMAKIGQLFLQKGNWNGKQIVSEKWMSILVTKTFSTGEAHGFFDYALHTWVSPNNSAYLLSGMLGQNVWICPETDVVVVITSGNNDLFERSDVLRIVADTMSDVTKCSKTPLPKNKKAYMELRKAESHFADRHRFAKPLPEKGKVWQLLCRFIHRDPAPLPDQLSLYQGNYLFEKNNVGLLPLFLRFMQNNHTKGITRLRFVRKGNRFYLVFEEGVESHTVEVGFYRKAMGQLNFGGEQYLVACGGECAITEDGNPVLKVDLIFPEIPNSRRIKLFPEKDTMRVELTELPGKEMVESLITQFVPDVLRGGGIAAFVRTKLFGVDPFKCITPMMEPTLTAYAESTPATVPLGATGKPSPKADPSTHPSLPPSIPNATPSSASKPRTNA